MNAQDPDEPAAKVPGRDCAAWGRVIDDAVRFYARYCGAPLPPRLGGVLWDLIDAGDRWKRAHGIPTAEACPSDCRSENVTYVSTQQAAEMIGTRERNVRDLVARGRLRADPADKGRALQIHLDSVEAYISERKSAA